MAKSLIFSDLHFGDPVCLLRRKSVTDGLKKFLSKNSPIDEIIFAGDILDANISSLTVAIDGSGTAKWPKQIGFRNWLGYILEVVSDKARIVYIPGNHDYIIWNILSTNKAFVEPISRGLVPTGLPLMKTNFDDPFIKGVAPPAFRNSFSVIYPDYEFNLSGKNVLVTHGHYLDKKQTLFKNLEKYIENERGNTKKAVRAFFIATAQYQAGGNIVSYKGFSRKAVDYIHKTMESAVDVRQKAAYSVARFLGALRNQPIDLKMLMVIEMYLKYFSQSNPDIFIFGHTHKVSRSSTRLIKEQQRKKLLNKDIDVWNTGSFVENQGENSVGSFILTDDSPTTGGSIKVFSVDLKGNVKEKAL